MKITSAAGEHCWRNFYLVSPEIWCDGIQLHSVLEADDQAGYVVQPKFDEHGLFVHVDGELVTQRRTGTVRFVGGHRRAETR